MGITVFYFNLETTRMNYKILSVKILIILTYIKTVAHFKEASVNLSLRRENESIHTSDTETIT